MVQDFRSGMIVGPRRWAMRIMAWAVCGAMAAGLVSCKRSPVADTSSPRKVAVAFARAAEAGDTATLHQVATGTDAEFELVKDLGIYMQAVKRFKAAAIDRFGDEGRNFTGMPLDVAADFESAQEKVEGNTATLIPPTAEAEPMKLVKDGDNWKLDLKFLDKDAIATQSTKALAAKAKVLDGISKDLEEHEIKTMFDLKSALAKHSAGNAPAGSTPPAE